MDKWLAKQIEAKALQRLQELINARIEPIVFCTCPCIHCSNQAHWLCHGDGVEIDTQQS